MALLFTIHAKTAQFLVALVHIAPQTKALGVHIPMRMTPITLPCNCYGGC